MSSTHTLPKLHNAMSPGLVGKGTGEGQEPPISLDADAFVRFSQAFDGSIDGITMRPVLPTTDFSFDFQDLSFVKAP